MVCVFGSRDNHGLCFICVKYQVKINKRMLQCMKGTHYYDVSKMEQRKEVKWRMFCQNYGVNLMGAWLFFSKYCSNLHACKIMNDLVSTVDT